MITIKNVHSKVLVLDNFTPVDGANPTIGSLNQQEFVEEVKLEVVCSEEVLSDVLRSLEMRILMKNQQSTSSH